MIRSSRSARCEILRQRDLDIVRHRRARVAAAGRALRPPAPRQSVRQARFTCGAQRPTQNAEAEHLRRQRAPQRFARHGRLHAIGSVGTLQRIDDRSAEQPTDFVVSQLVDQALKSVARRHGRAASCTSTQSSSAASDASARRPARTESTRSAPPSRSRPADRAQATACANGDRRPRARRRCRSQSRFRQETVQ